MYQYPLELSFKILALAPQVSVTDANGQLLFYVRQKLFKLKESVTVFADVEQTRPIYMLSADRVFDWSARYNFTDEYGNDLGAVKRQGMRSLFKAHFDILEGDTPIMTLQEENPWVKFIDELVGQIPIVGLFTGYLFHPAYLVSRPDGQVVMRLEKLPAFLEGKFRIENKMPLDEREEIRVLLSLLMMLLLERSRG